MVEPCSLGASNKPKPENCEFKKAANDVEKSLIFTKHSESVTFLDRSMGAKPLNAIIPDIKSTKCRQKKAHELQIILDQLTQNDDNWRASCLTREPRKVSQPANEEELLQKFLADSLLPTPSIQPEKD